MSPSDLKKLKINGLYLLFEKWDETHSDFYKIVELQTQPNGSLVFFCEEEHSFYEPKDVEVCCIESYESMLVTN